MQPINVFLTDRFIIFNSPEMEASERIVETIDEKDQIDSILAKLSSLLDGRAPSSATKVNLIIDHNFLPYYYFELPPLTHRKLNNILEFELENTLLLGSTEYYYDYCSRRPKDRPISEVGVFAFRKEWLEKIRQICRDTNLDIQWVLSLNNLLDLRFQEEFSPEDEIHVHLAERLARIFVYREGFMVGFSTVTFPGETANRNTIQEFLDRINQKIGIIRIAENQVCQVTINRSDLSGIFVNDKMELEMSEMEECILSTFDPLQLISPSIFSNKRRVNLYKSDLLLLKEIKRHTRKLVVSGCILLACLILYGSSAVFKGITLSQQHASLKKEYSRTVKKYIPKGSASNAVKILKEKLSTIRQKQVESQRFEKREYPISTILRDISLVKAKVSSFHLNKFYSNNQLITIQGRVSSLIDFDQLRDQINRLFPKEQYKVKTSQQSSGNEGVQFSISIHILG